VSRQNAGFCKLLNQIALGKNLIMEPAEVGILEVLISFDYAQGVADVGNQQLVFSEVRMTPMGKAFLEECNNSDPLVR
jgi:hypothetical protein